MYTSTNLSTCLGLANDPHILAKEHMLSLPSNQSKWSLQPFVYEGPYFYIYLFQLFVVLTPKALGEIEPFHS